MIILTEPQVKEDIETLWRDVRATYEPDALVTILHGGDFVGETIYELSGIPLYKILIQRPDRKKVYQKIARINKFLAWIVYEILFLIDMPKVSEPIIVPKSKKILLIEDGIHTGKTLRAAKIALKRFTPKEVRVLSLLDLHKPRLADFSLYHEKVSFPWSLDNPTNFQMGKNYNF